MDLDLGLMLVRLALGPMLVVHGLNKVFGSGGLAGTTRWFEHLGLRPAAWHARLAATLEVLAGAAMTLGLLSSVAATAYVGLMAVALATDHRGKGYFVFQGGFEYTIVIGMTAVAMASLGPGRWSLDHLLGIAWVGVGWAVAAVVVGLAGAAALMAACYRPFRAAT
ncbi:DoxX family protein [Rhodococcus rhodochrous]|uniref:DoxX family protein n=1 Tax=Rhodococcus rhodochrous TaxID=1829 RepID=UPI0002FF0DED|nr:DoxX family protein [Rhodococcus rhodochrous]